MTDIFPPPFSVVVHKIDALENTETQHGYLMALMRHRAMLAAAPAQDEDGDTIKNLQARVADLEAQLYAIGAGGVGSTVARQDHPEQHLDMVPAGWKLVPVEPNMSMTQSALNASRRWAECDAPLPRGQELWAAKVCWQAMLAAAPQPPTAEKSSVVEQPQSVTDCHQSQPQVAPPGSTESAYQRGYLDGMAKGRRDAAMDADARVFYDHDTSEVDRYLGFKPTVPLYTHPQPKREPLTDEQQIAEALRRHGLVLVKTANGYDVLKLGQITAHGIGGAA